MSLSCENNRKVIILEEKIYQFVKLLQCLIPPLEAAILHTATLGTNAKSTMKYPSLLRANSAKIVLI